MPASDAFSKPAKPKDTPLLECVFQRIEKSGEDSIPFSDYVELALYHPEWGYYARPESRPVGRSGDFFTSVSVGETFGMLLAGRIERVREEIPPPKGEPFLIVEQGAHDGQLAVDIAKALLEGNDRSKGPWLYRVVEPREGVGEAMRGRFQREGLGERVEVVSSLADAAGDCGVFLCNELLDAFPFDRVAFEKGRWREIRVARDGDGLAWRRAPARDRLRPWTERLGSDFPEGYTTELRPDLGAWVDEAAGLFRRGCWWIVDYGFESEDYFSPHRGDGTWRCFRGHRATEDPFSHPGETDITAHVNFSHLREAAEGAGLRWDGLTDQHHFLTEAARPWLMEWEGREPDAEMRAKLRQFQTLTHPGMMGKQFKVARLSRSAPGSRE